MNEIVASPRMDASEQPLNKLGNLLTTTTGLEFSVLMGSHATHRARPDSDWDIALKWHSTAPWMQTVGDQEILRRRIAQALEVSPDRVDLIDLTRASAAENGMYSMAKVLFPGMWAPEK